MSGHHIAVEDKKADAVTHLAIARSQNTENGISGDLHKRGRQLREQLPDFLRRMRRTPTFLFTTTSLGIVLF